MKRFVLLPAILVAAFAFLVYLYTAPKFMLWLDGARFVACIARLEICNPPQSFHVLIAHLMTKIPIGSIIFRIQFLSMLYAGAALVLIYFFILKLLNEKLDTNVSHSSGAPATFRRGIPSRSKQVSSLFSHNLTKFFSAIFAAATLAFSYEFWSQAHNVETFILIVLMEIGVLYLLLIGINDKNFFKRMLLVATIFGLSTGTNPIFLSVFPVSLIILWRYKRELNWKNMVAFAFAGLAATVLVHLYMPIKAVQNPFINWGRPTGWSGFWEVSTGQGLNVYLPDINRVNGFTGSPLVFAKSSWNYFKMIWLNFTPLIIPFILIGGWNLFAKNRKIFYPLISTAIANFIFSGLYYSGNQESWFLMSYVVFVIFAGVGFYFLITELADKLPKSLKKLKNYGQALVVLPMILLIVHWPMLNRRGWVLTQDYIDNLYRPIKTPAILIGSSDLYDAVSLYVHEMEKGEKAKVVPITDNMFFVLKWYRENLRLTTPITIPDDSYVGHNDADEYSRYINDLIKANFKKFNIYITLPSLTNNFLPRADFAPSLIVDQQFKLIPQGMIYEIVPKQATAEPNLAYFKYSFKSPGFPQKKPAFLERVYNSEFTGMFNEFAISYQNLADYYANLGKKDEALKNYQKAYDFNPKNGQIVSRLGNFYGSQNDHHRALYYFKKALDLDKDNISIMLNIATAAENIGNSQEAGQMYQKILQKAKGNSNIAQIAYQKLNAITNPLPTIPPNIKKFNDPSLNVEFSYLPDYSLKYIGEKLIQVSPTKQDKDQSAITIFSKILKEDETPDKFVLTLPFKIAGKFVSSQPNRIGDFEAVVNVYDDNGVQTHLVLMKKGKQGFAVRIVPANKPSAAANVILQTMKTIR